MAYKLGPTEKKKSLSLSAEASSTNEYENGFLEPNKNFLHQPLPCVLLNKTKFKRISRFEPFALE